MGRSSVVQNSVRRVIRKSFYSTGHWCSVRLTSWMSESLLRTLGGNQRFGGVSFHVWKHAFSVWERITDWPSSCPGSDSLSVTLCGRFQFYTRRRLGWWALFLSKPCWSTRVAKCLLGSHASFVPGGDLQVVAIALVSPAIPILLLEELHVWGGF
jgi:hypothetical protein